jgi:hypothetical protein
VMQSFSRNQPDRDVCDEAIRALED